MNAFGIGYRTVVITPGEDNDLWDQFLALRYQSFGAWEGSDPCVGRETDARDSYSVFVLAMLRGEIIAGCRLIDGERTWVSLPRALVVPGKYFEISRMLIRRDVTERDIRDHAFLILCQRIAQYAFEERGYDDLYCDTRLPFFRTLRGIFGDAIQEIGSHHQVFEKNGDVLTLVPMRVNRSAVPEMRYRVCEQLTRLCQP